MRDALTGLIAAVDAILTAPEMPEEILARMELYQRVGKKNGAVIKQTRERITAARLADLVRAYETAKVAIHDRPLADAGLTSYRYRGPYGWIMIGAKDHTDAMREAARSTAAPTMENLEVWNGREYVKA